MKIWKCENVANVKNETGIENNSRITIKII